MSLFFYKAVKTFICTFCPVIYRFTFIRICMLILKKSRKVISKSVKNYIISDCFKSSSVGACLKSCFLNLVGLNVAKGTTVPPYVRSCQ